MITIFTKPNNSSSKQAQQWLKERQIPFKTVSYANLSLSDLIKILSLTDTGVPQIQAKRTSRDTAETFRVNHLIEEASSISTLLNLMKSYPQRFKAPIIIDDNKLLIGFNDEEIRKFLPRQRKIQHRFLN